MWRHALDRLKWASRINPQILFIYNQLSVPLAVKLEMESCSLGVASHSSSGAGPIQLSCRCGDKAPFARGSRWRGSCDD